MAMKIGQTVYTVNNETNEVDSWEYGGCLRTEDELLVHLMRGKQYCYLPARCVFASESEALAVANKQN